MFERKDYKKRAKELLKGKQGSASSGRIKPWESALFVTLTAGALLLLSCVGRRESFLTNLLYIISFAVSGSVTIAYTTFFIKMHNAAGAAHFTDFINAFGAYAEGILAFLWRALWTALWSLLFIIPGIVKSYSYSMMFFVIAENPELGPLKAMNLSKALTRNHKADLFVLDLSFLLWHVLSLCTSGILYLWTAPYITASKTNAYYALKQEAFITGTLSPADFESR